MSLEYLSQIQKCEAAYDARLAEIGDEALLHGAKIILITGGSCAGKTTTTAKLRHYLDSHGKNVHCISLDDFYRWGDERVRLPDGKLDIESPASLRLDLISDAIKSLLNGERTLLPRFDFVLEKRFDAARELDPDDSDMFLIEGLHAHNPLISPSGIAGIFKLYLHAVPENCEINPRIVRRLVRDSLYRGASAERTFAQWAQVIGEEKKSIEPFFDSADSRFFTYLDYERDVLGRFALAELDTLPSGSEYMPLAESIRRYLDGCGCIPVSAVPPHSLLREFI